MSKESLGFEGNVKVKVYNPYTEKTRHYEKHNLILDTFYTHLIELILSIDSGTPEFLAVGTGTTEPKPDDKELEDEKHRASVSSRIQDGLTAVITGQIRDGTYEGDINEAGLFDSNTGGSNNLLCRTVFDETIEKEEMEVVTISWEISINK